MADTKISALPASTTPLAGTEVLPIVQSSATKQVSVANLTAGRAISATQLTLTTGNLVVSSGKGIDFSATPGTGTTELLADYEEGTWTPTDASGAGLTFSTAIGHYTKIGNMVYAAFQANYPVTASGSNAAVGNLPFTTGAYSATQIFGGFLNYSSIATSFFGLTFPSTTTVFFFAPSATQITNVQLSGGQVRMTVVYQAV